MGFNIICLMGPTASGKTDLSLRLAEDIPCEIVSVDSAMVYKEMDIGTAKPSLFERSKVPHHLIDIEDPSQPYSAARFRHDALSAIEDIHSRGKIPLLVGGTMLYFKALQQGLSPLPSANEEIRGKLLEEGKQIGWQAMHKRLSAVDPISAARINSNDPQRIQRALEVYEITRQPMSALWQLEEASALPFQCINIGVAPEERTVLHNRIAERFKKMLKDGFIEEVQQLRQIENLHRDLPAVRSVGYRQVWQYLENEINYQGLLEQGIAATRQLAKRQLTWLRHWDSITWFDSTHSHVYESLRGFITSSH